MNGTIDPITARYIATCYPGSGHPSLDHWINFFIEIGKSNETVTIDLEKIADAFPTFAFCYKIGLIQLIGSQQYFEGFTYSEDLFENLFDENPILETILRTRFGQPNEQFVNIHNIDRYVFARARKADARLPMEIVLNNSIHCSVRIATKTKEGYEIYSFGGSYSVSGIDTGIFGLPPDADFYFVHGMNDEKPIAIRTADADERIRMEQHFGSYSRKPSRNPFV